MSINIRFLVGAALSFTLATAQNVEASSNRQDMPGLMAGSTRRPLPPIAVHHEAVPEDYPETPAALSPHTAIDYGVQDAGNFFPDIDADSAASLTTTGTSGISSSRSDTATSELSSSGSYSSTAGAASAGDSYRSFSTSSSGSTQTFSTESSGPEPELLRMTYCDHYLVRRDARPLLHNLAQAFSLTSTNTMPGQTPSSTASRPFSEGMGDEY